MDEPDSPPGNLPTDSIDKAVKELDAVYADASSETEHIVAAHQRLLMTLVDAVRTLTTEINRLRSHDPPS